MPFESEEAAHNAFGSIKMYFRGKDLLGVEDVRVRGYVFLSKDLDKLNVIDNAAEGSRAKAVDTGITYIFCSGEWMAEIVPNPQYDWDPMDDDTDWENLGNESDPTDDDEEYDWEEI